MQDNAERIKDHLARQFHLPEEQIDSMLPSFLATLRTHMENLQAALKENNPDNIGKAGHTIKGAFLNLGLEECAEIAFDIEQKGKRGDPGVDFQQLYNNLCSRVGPVIDH